MACKEVWSSDVCPICSKQVEIFNEGDFQFSMDLHMQSHKPLQELSEQHNKAQLNNKNTKNHMFYSEFNKNVKISNNDVNCDTKSPGHNKFVETGRQKPATNNNIKEDLDESPTYLKNENTFLQPVFKEELHSLDCDTKSPSHDKFVETVRPEPATNSNIKVYLDENPTYFKNDKTLQPVLKNTFHCLVCDVIFKKASKEKHLQLGSHMLAVGKHILIKLSNTNESVKDCITLFKVKNNCFICTACQSKIMYSDSEQSFTRRFLDHTCGKIHKRNVGGIYSQLLEKCKASEPVVEANSKFLEIKLGDKIYCTLCSCYILRSCDEEVFKKYLLAHLSTSSHNLSGNYEPLLSENSEKHCLDCDTKSPNNNKFVETVRPEPAPNSDIKIYLDENPTYFINVNILQPVFENKFHCLVCDLIFKKASKHLQLASHIQAVGKHILIKLSKSDERVKNCITLFKVKNDCFICRPCHGKIMYSDSEQSFTSSILNHTSEEIHKRKVGEIYSQLLEKCKASQPVVEANSTFLEIILGDKIYCTLCSCYILCSCDERVFKKYLLAHLSTSRHNLSGSYESSLSKNSEKHCLDCDTKSLSYNKFVETVTPEPATNDTIDTNYIKAVGRRILIKLSENDESVKSCITLFKVKKKYLTCRPCQSNIMYSDSEQSFTSSILNHTAGKIHKRNVGEIYSQLLEKCKASEPVVKANSNFLKIKLGENIYCTLCSCDILGSCKEDVFKKYLLAHLSTSRHNISGNNDSFLSENSEKHCLDRETKSPSHNNFVETVKPEPATNNTKKTHEGSEKTKNTDKTL